MKVWHLWRRGLHASHEEIEQLVVRASDEADARMVAQSYANDRGHGDVQRGTTVRRHTWTDSSCSYCEELTGIGDREVVIADTLS
jgi:hypothetical protein